MIEDFFIIGIKVSNVDIGMLGAFGLQNLHAESYLIPHQDVAVVELVLAKVQHIVPVHLNIGPIIVFHLVGKLICGVHRLAKDDGIGIDGLTPAVEVPFQIRGLAEFLIGQLRVGHASAD